MLTPQKMKNIDTNLEMLKINDSLETIKLSPLHELDFNICNYYIGIWNANEIEENATVFPYMYTDWKESSNILKQDVQNLLKLIEEDKKNYENLNIENQKLKEEQQKTNKEIQKVKQLNTILYNKNQEILKDHVKTYEYLNAILNSKSYKLIQLIRKILRRK